LTGPAQGNASPDGSTLKVDAPKLVSTIGGSRIDTDKVTLVFQAVSGSFVGGQAFTYRVQLMNNGGSVIEEQTGGGLSYTMNSTLDFDTLYRWRARAELGSAVGPWSNTESFKSVDKKLGYIAAQEIYDPLNEGVSVGRINGPVSFSSLGIRTHDEATYVEYTLPQPLRAGEYSALVTNLSNCCNGEDPKWRVLSMREGGAQFNDNEYRMSVEKRGNGATAWRFLTGPGDYIETNSADRAASRYRFDPSQTYFYRVTWGNNVFRVQILEGGVNGVTIYDMSRGYSREYTPFPHNVYIGSPYAAGDRGEPASYDGMIVRQVWVSANPRPSFANK